jgi:hypothetical protein
VALDFPGGLSALTGANSFIPGASRSRLKSRIWRYAQRWHFHATGVGDFALVLILLTPLPLGRDEVHHATITGLITCHTGQPDCRYRIVGGWPAV